MATKKAKKARKKPTLDGGDTPITIGGGGGAFPKILTPLSIKYDASVWQQSDPPGTLTLKGGKFKNITIAEGGIVLVNLPLIGAVTIGLTCGKPLKTSGR
jgi:hypothetical protein